jgi:hypothetical protein
MSQIDQEDDVGPLVPRPDMEFLDIRADAEGFHWIADLHVFEVVGLVIALALLAASLVA